MVENNFLYIHEETSNFLNSKVKPLYSVICFLNDRLRKRDSPESLSTDI